MYLWFPVPRRIRFVAVKWIGGYYQVISGKAQPSGDTEYAEVYAVKSINLEDADRRWPHLSTRLQPRNLIWLGHADITWFTL